MAEGRKAPPAFVGRLVSALREKIPGAEITYEPIRGDCYRFFVISATFTDVGHPERQRLVWDVASNVVDKGSLFDVGMIITMSPDELPSADDGEEADSLADATN